MRPRLSLNEGGVREQGEQGGGGGGTQLQTASVPFRIRSQRLVCKGGLRERGVAEEKEGAGERGKREECYKRAGGARG